MEFLFDSANLEDIKKYSKIFPITGVTSNPSIIKKEGKIELFRHFCDIRKVSGMERSLHIQVTGRDGDTMIREGRTILDKVDKNVFIKIPTTEEGLKAMRVLKTEGQASRQLRFIPRYRGIWPWRRELILLLHTLTEWKTWISTQLIPSPALRTRSQLEVIRQRSWRQALRTLPR